MWLGSLIPHCVEEPVCVALFKVHSPRMLPEISSVKSRLSVPAKGCHKAELHIDKNCVSGIRSMLALLTEICIHVCLSDYHIEVWVDNPVAPPCLADLKNHSSL